MVRVIFFAVPLIAFVTCTEYVPLSDRGKTVEVIEQSYLRGERSERCAEMAQYEVSAIPAEQPDHDRATVLEIKARNEAVRREATHILLWPESEFPCEKDGTPNEEAERVCRQQKVTAYQCLIGRGT